MRFSSLPLLALSVFSASSYAIENGTPIDWSQQDNAVRFDSRQTGRQGLCTGTLVAGRFVLTAAHCLVESELDSFTTAFGENYSSSSFVNHENYFEDGGFSGEDIGIVVADNFIDYHNIQFLSINEHSAGEKLTIAGFGDTIDTLNHADFTFSHYYPNPDDPDNPFVVYADMVNDSHTTGGDSGSAWVNKNSEIIAIHKGSTHYVSGERTTYGTDIKAVKDFITDNIDGWHYPTLVDADGRTTITVQSLHRDDVSDDAYVDGDVTLVPEDSTCMTNGLIQPFEKCTYVIESAGGEGELYLSDSEIIHINKPVETPDGNGDGDNSDDNSGGSMGFWPLILFGVALRRRKM
ncbi:GlyGly-CTERM sorting domain-containing protein [Vibrio parahaemolyticus]|uniref:trypsin-like serine protease n=1 Tax=Vibrio parahaemolyticus TaxID=670 RepID=UPI001122D95C|nr:trypsin-like serine protease [Vibrio parahaemolyticus]TOM63475.1 GlyGly-CTERM sorting domain-containing protein [Vibrio parahaemolyticus]TOM64364.1 GlyGly-CTERM sorting domain-containing protein [Vibrio parahaemolyticus]TOM69254.1 GlyGly-CTERM sorting domain-containing protein [Vibrio parahaemolyticus]TOO90066.1 GlyGly-CTERM sorting domain-containing protein [Vibrio parahaemolyticus]